ncbi:2-C-methyl-D-erythritol 2,4-cyclodiphosphate synthase [Ectothiorhodospiraceae bacterium WFHF3C12]|nr:2-C-methyl-D-erythritol 2,4-cyclodiphosphate synthase [Ectothiorhodospiraceae bacterium WFHF3C12]
MRIGQGFDAHRFIAGARLVLGGVEIPFELGLQAHSDGDCLLHAITDALLGAAALGDLGSHFPDTDERLAGIDSRRLLLDVLAKVRAAGYRVGNVDSTIIAQKPRLAPHIGRMRAVVAQDLELPEERVSVKATTTERMGFTGREEGIAAMAVVTIVGAS